MNIRTDLAYEDALQNSFPIDERIIGNDKIYHLSIEKENEEKYKKKQGEYYTIISEALTNNKYDDIEGTITVLKEVLCEIYKSVGLGENSSVLLVGLGNDSVTPDALGPYVLHRTIVSRHMFITNPENVEKGLREVSGITPGVMGQTGIETSDVVLSIAKEIKPDLVIVIDSLAAKSLGRINKTIQITNAGINPGSGVGNRRKEISRETLGIPVIAIGVPTVVDVSSIISETLEYMLKKLEAMESNQSNPLAINEKIEYEQMPEPTNQSKRRYLGEVGTLSIEDKERLIHEVLTPNGYDMMVTPKEIDDQLETISEIISNAINKSLHSII